MTLSRLDGAPISFVTRILEADDLQFQDVDFQVHLFRKSTQFLINNLNLSDPCKNSNYLTLCKLKSAPQKMPP